jgi:hypothetical protein
MQLWIMDPATGVDSMAVHRLDASPETVSWCYFDAALNPQLTIDSGCGVGGVALVSA